jgi:Cu-processing system permease protein
VTVRPDWKFVAIIARQEIRIALRSRWVAIYAAVLAILTLAVSYFGLVVIEFTGFQEFNRTAVSLLNLVLYIVPLAGMLMAIPSFRGEGGATDQLFVEPVTRTEIVLGKIAGLSGAHLLATLAGFGFTGVLVGVKVNTSGILSYLVLVGFTILLGIVFISMASMLAILAHRAAKAYAVTLISWFVLVLLFDLLILGLGILLPEVWGNRIAFAGIFLNPVDATRVGTLLAVSGKEMFGPAGAQLVRTLGGTTQSVLLLVGVLLGWIAFSTAVATAALNRQDL